VNQNSPLFFVETSLEKEFKALPSLASLISQITPLKAEAKNLFQDAGPKWKDPNAFAMIVLPAARANEFKEIPEDVRSKVLSGAVRFIFMQATGEENFPLPATFISEATTPETTDFLFSQITRVPGWGLVSSMPEKSEILIERITNEEQVAKKIELSIEFLVEHNKLMKGQTLSLRSALTMAFSAALDFSAGRKIKPPVFQIAASKENFAISLRWPVDGIDVDAWLNPEYRWRAIFTEATSSIVLLNPETLETEVQLLFVPGQTGLSLHGRPATVDMLTQTRYQLAHQLPSLAEDIIFHHFKVKNGDTSPSDFEGVEIPAPQVVPNKENPQLELTGLRVEHQKLEKQLKGVQEQLSEQTRKMAQATDAEKKAQIQIKQLTTQLEGLKTSSAAQLKKETDAMKLRLENAKEKELELTKKLNQTIEQAKVKTGKGAAGAA
jgi:hypothetical protein